MTRRPRGSITEPALLAGSFVGRALNSRSVAMWRVSKPKLRVEERQGVGGLARVVGALDSRDIRPVLTDPARPLSTRCNEGHAGLNSWIQTVDFKRLIWRRGWDSNPRALSSKTLSRRPRYDHFGTSPGVRPRTQAAKFMRNSLKAHTISAIAWFRTRG